jgi:hypothetical protein
MTTDNTGRSHVSLAGRAANNKDFSERSAVDVVAG